MAGFIAKRLNKEKTLGERLASLRESYKIKLPTLSKTLHIQEKYLADLEAGRWETLPEEIYVRNFIRSYARAFGRDSAPFLDLYELELASARSRRPKELLVPNTSISGRDLLPSIFIFRVVLAVILGLGLFSYLGFEVKRITSPPSLLILEPENNSMSISGEIVVHGKSEPEALIQINGENALADGNGNFKETVRLQRGVNLIKISASKRRSKENTIYRRVVYEEAAKQAP